MDGDRLEEQDPFTINTPEFLNTSHHHHPALFRPLPAFQSPPTPITPVRFAIPAIMDPNAPTVIDARDVPADEQELGASQPRFERGRGPSPEAGPSNPRRHHHHHIRQPQTPPSTFSWADALPLNPPVRNVRAYTNEASFDALNHLPPSYRRTLRKKLDALKREDVNDRVARDEDLRNVRGGLARHVDPMAGARVLVEIERIDGKALMEKVAHWNKSLPTQTSLRDLYHRRPDLFPTQLLPTPPSDTEVSEDETRAGGSGTTTTDSSSSRPTTLHFDHLFAPQQQQQNNNVDPQPSAPRGLTPFAEDDRAFDMDEQLPPRTLFPAHPNAVLLPEGAEAELEFMKGKMEFTMDAPCFRKDVIDIGVKGVGVPASNNKPVDVVRVKEEEVEPESLSSESKRSGSGTDTEPEDEPQAGPSTPSASPNKRKRFPVTTPARLLAHPDVRLGEIGPGLRSLQALHSSLIDLEQEEERRRARRLEKSRATDSYQTPSASSLSSSSASFSSTSTRHRSPSPTDSIMSDSSISSETFTSTLSKLVGASILKTAESCLNVAEPEVMLGYTWLGLDEARVVGRKWLELVPVGSLGSYTSSTPAPGGGASSRRSVTPSPNVATDPLSSFDGEGGVFTSGPLKGYGCHFFGRQPTSNMRGLQPAWMGKEQAWTRAGYDPVNLTGKLCMFVLVQPEWALPVRTLSDLSQSQEFTDGARGEKAFTTFEAVWALLVDVCRRYGIRHFAVTSATNIALGAFSPTYQTGYMSPPISTTSAPMTTRGRLNPKDKDSYKPTALQMLMYWMRCSMGSFSETWNIPEHAGLTGIPGDAAFGYREKFWSTPNVEPASRDAARLVNRRIASTKRNAEAEDGQLFTEVRFAQMSQSVDQEERSKNRGNEMVRVLSQGIKRRFEDRDAGDEDVAVYQEVALDFLLPPEEREKQAAVEHRYWRDAVAGGSVYLRVSKKRRMSGEDAPTMAAEEEEEDEEAAVEAIIDREETSSMVHMDLADAEEDLGPYYAPRRLQPQPCPLPSRTLSALQREESLILVQDGPITPAGQRRWVDTLTRKRYLELGHHVIEVDGSLRAAIDAAQNANLLSVNTTVGAFPVTPTATNTDTTDTENSMTGGESAGTTMFSSSGASRDRSSPAEGARKRKIPYRACRASVAPDQHHVSSLPTPPPSAGGSSRRSSAAGGGGVTRITKPMPRKKRDSRAKSVTFQEQGDDDDHMGDDDDGGDNSMDVDGDAEDEAETEEEERESSVGHFYNTRSRSRSRSVSVRLRSETPVPEQYQHQQHHHLTSSLRRSGRKSYPTVPVSPAQSPSSNMARRKSTGNLGFREREKTPTPQSFAQQQRWGLREAAGYEDDEDDEDASDDDQDDEDDRERTPGPSTRSKRRRMTSPAVEMVLPARQRRVSTRSTRAMQY
ncbi:hypothetical protein FRC04_003121 [Tulasnella sp. 424]|nr:hypothetical protein FRC04_003121 [Tulasnella sp. 424]KAG8967516.1 hypothetical protein FRC05_002028 [Tulasnella sp. 425]